MLAILPNYVDASSLYLEELTKVLLLYDKAVVPDLELTRNRAAPTPHLAADLDFLVERNLIVGADPATNRIARADPAVVLEEDRIWHLRTRPASYRAMKYRHFPGSEEFEGAMIDQIERRSPEYRRRAEHHVARALATELRKQGDTAISVFDTKGALLDGPNLRKQAVIRVVMEKIPCPAPNVAWDDIIAFREEASSRRSLLAMRRWIRGLAEQNIGENEIREEVGYLSGEYARSLKRGKLRGATSTLEACFTIGAEIAECLAKMEFGKLAQIGLHLLKATDDVLESEVPLRGEEMSYLVRLQRLGPA